MYEQVEKLKENESRAVGNSIIQNKNSVKQAFEFVDNRETLQLKRLSQIVRPVQLMGCAASTSAGTTRHSKHLSRKHSELIKKIDRANCEIQSLRRRHAKAPLHLFQ